MIVVVFLLGYDFGFASDASIAPNRQNFSLICSNLVGLCSDLVGCVIRKFLQNDFLNIFTNATIHCKMKIFYGKYFTSKQMERYCILHHGFEIFLVGLWEPMLLALEISDGTSLTK